MALLKSIINFIQGCKQQPLSTTSKGALYEKKACRYLKRQGLRLVTKNFRCYFGEIDLIMQDKDSLVFVEVRYRFHSHYQSSLESVDYYKQQRLRRVAEHYLQRIKNSEHPCRFDIVGFDQEKLSWIKNAF